MKTQIIFKRVRGTPRTLLDLPRHFLDHPKIVQFLTKVGLKDLLRPPRHIPDDPNNFKQISKTCQFSWKFWVRAVDLTTRLRRVIATPGARPRCGLRRFFLSKKTTSETQIMRIYQKIDIIICFLRQTYNNMIIE